MTEPATGAPVGGVVLIGPPGAAVEEVGARVAAALNRPAWSSDTAVARDSGRPDAAEAFLDLGEKEFRHRERTLVLAALADPRLAGAVFVLGGGAPLDAAVAAALPAAGSVVLLEVTVTDAARRLGLAGGIPGLVSPRREWITMMEARRPAYRAVATVTVDTDGRDPNQVAEEVVRLLAAGATTTEGRA